MKKRLITVLLAALLVFSAAACGDNGKVPGEEGGQNTPDTEKYTDSFAYVSDYDRLYRQPVDGGDLVLLAEDVTYSAQDKEYVSYISMNGDMYMLNMKTSETKKIPGEGIMMPPTVTGGRTVYSVYSNDTHSSSLYVFDFDSGETHTVMEQFNEGQIYADGNDLIFVNYTMEEEVFKTALIHYDLEKKEITWTIEDADIYDMFLSRGTMYLELKDEEENDPKWYKVDPATGERTLAEMDIYNSDFLMLNEDDGIWAYNNDRGALTYISGDTRTEAVTWDDDGMVYVRGRYDDKVLLCREDYRLYEPLNHWYRTERYYVAGKGPDNVREITALGEYGSMFKDGDFPVLDSSTARKPVTTAIYSFFCLENGVEGAEPLCSTTHNAWLNIADKTVDLALLAAPTDEEKAYLEEKGVEVEMKLYGGDGLVFISNKECGVTDLTIDQIRAIYRGEIRNWKELGGVDHEINVLYRDDQSGSQRLFENMVWKGEDVPDFQKLGFERLDEMSTIVMCCVADPYAIGYSIMTYLNDTFDYEQLQAFSLDGVKPTPENVASKEYALGTRGYVVIRSDEPEDSPARRLYNWFGTSVCDSILDANGVTPLSE